MATHQAVHTIAQPESAEEVARLLVDPSMEAAVRELSTEVVRGVVAASRGGAVDLRGVPDQLVNAFSPALADGMRRDIAPAIEGVARQSTQAVLEEALSAGNLRRMQVLGAAVTEEAVGALTDEVVTTLMPAVVSELIDSVEEAEGRVDIAYVQNAAGQVSYAVARQAVLGANDGFRALQQQHGRFIGESIRGPIEQTLSWLPRIALLLGLLLLITSGSLAWLAFLMGRNRRDDQRALAQRDEAIMLLLGLMKSSNDDRWPDAMREMLRENRRDES